MGEPQPVPSDDGADEFVDELKPGTALMHGQYTIESFLNAGGFGITYRAKDSLDRQVVIKECFPGAFCRRSRYLVNARSRAHQNELESIVRLFVQEARSLAKLDHPNIVGVHNVFEENNTAYMALDYVEGRDLLEIIEDEETQLKPEQVVNILKEILGAVGFVHDQGLLHRDISPDNILVDETMHPVLIDFGAAREQATKQSRVLSALRVVKDGYSPQEFYVQGSLQGPFSDLYALGASFYHAIIGEAPANSQARLAAIASGQDDPYLPLVGRVPELDENVLKSIDKALEVLPKNRVQSAGEWLALMEGRAPTAANLGASLKSPDPAKENDTERGRLLGTAAVIALLIGGVVATQTDLFSTGREAQSGIASTEGVSEEDSARFRLPIPDLPVVNEVEVAATETAAADPVVEDAPALIEEPIVEEVVVADATVAEDVDVVPVTEVAASEPALADLPPLDPALADVVSTMAVVVPEDEFIGPPLPDDWDLWTAAMIDIAEAWSALEPETQTASGPFETDIRPVARPERAEPVDVIIAATGPVATPGMPSDPASADSALPAEFTSYALPSMEALPPLPFGASLPRGVPSLELPVYAFASEVVDPMELAVSAMVQTASVPVLPIEGLFSTQENESRIYSVNGVSVETVSQFNAVVRETFDVEALTEVTVTVGTGLVGDPDVTEQELILPLAQDTRLLNGMIFRATQSDTGWVTTLIAAPPGVGGDLQVGDQLLAYVPTTELLRDRSSLSDLLSREIADGTTEFSFAVMRDDATWVASLSYANSLIEPQD